MKITFVGDIQDLVTHREVDARTLGIAAFIAFTGGTRDLGEIIHRFPRLTPDDVRLLVMIMIENQLATAEY